MSNINKVILVGHCVPDTFMLRSLVSRAVPQVELSNVNDLGALEVQADAQSLLLINRELDGSFPMASGIELIQQINMQEQPPTMLLISNYDDAQEAAQKAGAVEGFGKSELEGKGMETLLTLVG